MATTLDIIREYRSAVSGYWGNLGEGTECDLDVIYNLVSAHGNGTVPEEESAEARHSLDICPNGHGHWTMYCAEACNP